MSGGLSCRSPRLKASWWSWKSQIKINSSRTSEMGDLGYCAKKKNYTFTILNKWCIQIYDVLSIVTAICQFIDLYVFFFLKGGHSVNVHKNSLTWHFSQTTAGKVFLGRVCPSGEVLVNVTPFTFQVENLRKVTNLVSTQQAAWKGHCFNPIKIKRTVGLVVTPHLVSTHNGLMLLLR